MIKLTQTTMTVSEWDEVEDNPIQRNTELHANKARNKHLKTASPTHARVSAAQLPNGDVYKLDGHTRSYLWAEGSLEAPEYLLVDMYMVDNMAEVEELYQQFDNSAAAENSIDKLHGAYRLNNFKPKSSLVCYGGVVSALTTLVSPGQNRMNLYQEIHPWIEHLKMIDDEHFSQSRFVSGIFAACLLTVRIYGHSALTFWQAYNNDEGQKNGRSRDGVQALSEMVAQRRASRTLAGWGNMQDVCAKAISCFENYRKGICYTTGIKPTDLTLYKEKLNSQKSRKAA